LILAAQKFALQQMPFDPALQLAEQVLHLQAGQQVVEAIG
jgi:hypothetical protein